MKQRVLTALTLLLCFAFTAVNAQGTYDQATMGAKVVEMETASWGQNAPFNNYCWSTYGGSTHAKAGCVPVAFAIVMRYHGFPAEGTSSTLYNCQASTYVEITDRTYDWEKMPLTNGSGWTAEQQNEVAKLISHLGHAFGVDYGVSQTSVSIGDSQTERLTKYFNYKAASATSQYPSNNNLETWIQKIKESLNNGCPVPYAANNTGTGDSRHMFVIDGYTANNYFHFNFGWNGGSNGWFKLDNITPAQGDNYSWSDASDGYTSKHQAFFNLMPNKTPRTVTATATPSNMGTVSINGGTAGDNVSAEVIEGIKATLTAHPADGYALANWTKNGVIVGTKNSIQVTVGESGNDYVANFDLAANVQIEKDCTFNISNITTSGVNGSYCSTWTTSDGIVLSCTKGSEPAYALSTSVNTFFAKAPVGDSETLVSDITYTLTAPAGYIIKSYSFKGKSPSGSYTIDVTVGGNKTNVTYANAAVISASDVNAQSTSFVLGSTYAGRAGLSIMEDGVTVTIQSEGGEGEGGASTPTPDPEPEPTPELNVPTGATKLGVTFDGATWTRYNGDAIGTNNWIFKVVTATTPAVTVQVNGDVNNLGFSSINQVKHPYLYRGTNFVITVPGSYKIAGYKLTVKGDNFVNGTYTYTTGASTTGTGTISENGVEQTVVVNGLDTNTININVGNGSGTAGIIITALEIVYVNEEDTTDPLYHKQFRLKEKTTGTYMNIYDNATHDEGAKGGVNVAALNESSDGQKFQFVKSGNGYMLQSATGYYINCQAWNVDANSTTSGAVLTLEATENELEYLIHCSNGYFKIGAVDGDANIGKFVYCNESAKANASVWVFEEVVEGEEPEQPFPDGAYKVYWQADNRGYLAYHATDYPNEAKLAGVTYSGCQNLHYAVNEVDLVWYLITANDGKRYLFQAATGQFLGANPSIDERGIANKLSTTEAWPIAIKENTKYDSSGHYIITTVINGTNKLLCSGCGTDKTGHPVRWLNVDDTNQKDGGAPLQLVKVDNVTVADNVMNAVLAVINGNNEVPFKVEVEGLRENDPNTHFATITVGGTAVKLAPAHLEQSNIEATLLAGTTLAINHKYRGFEFNGFYIGTTSLGESVTLTAENVAAIDENNPLIAKFTATNTGEATLFSAEDEFSYRIPAIVKTVKDDKHKLIAISDYRHSFDDIGRDNHKTGTTQVDLVIRTSEDNGATWTAKQTIAEGSQHFGYGDAAAVANGQDVLVMAVAGNVFYAYADSNNPQQAYRIYSNDNGVTWEKEDISDNMESLFPDYYGLFFGSGKLAVDPDFNGSGNARVYGAILMKDSQGERNYVLYSDNWGKTWNILGNAVAARQNEPKVEILPNGQILLSARRGSGRTFNVFTYTDKANNTGTWDSATNGCDNGGNSTNGEIILLDAKKPDGTLTKILLQSQPYGSDRRNVSIWYKELSGDNFTALGIASDWTMGKQVSDQLSAYSAMCLQENGEIALFFEEAPCYGDDHTKGYSMVYVPLTIEEITGNNFLSPSAEVELVEFNIELTDGQGNIYRETLDYIPTDVAATLTAKYPFITLGENGVVADNKYTNTVTLPFKVSNAETTVWHNIYWPANTNENGYPVYLSASSATDTYVPKVTESKAYGESSYNTLNNGDKIAWAIYNVNNSFEFIFKNKLTGNYIKAENVATGNSQNVKYVEESKATAFTLLKKTGNYNGDYALKANVNGTDGYLCSTSATGYNYATHYFNNSNNGYGHQGAWAKFVEAPDYQAIVDALTANIAKFGEGDGNYTDNNDINAIKAIENIATTPLNTLNTHTETVQTVKESYRELVLTVNDDETATVPGSVSITVNGSAAETVNNKFVPANATVSILATANPGYRFVNWTRPAAQASAAARTAAARNSNFVSDQNPYEVTVSEALSLEANFEEIVVNATLTDAQGNTYEVQVSGFTAEITKDAVAEKLREAYPYITLGTVENVITLNENNGVYTYTNTVELPFKVSKTKDIWHNIYWPSNTKAYDYPVYLSASTADDTYVPKVTGSYAYGDHPTYNTKSGNDNISWAIYNVNNGFEFIFKNKVTNKYIVVRNVADKGAQNVQYFADAEYATAFTIEMKPEGQTYDTDAKYALAAEANSEIGYLCSTSATDYNYATHYNSNEHQGAWIEFKESPDYFSMIMDLGIALGYKFGAGDGKYIITDGIKVIDNAIANNSDNITLNTLNSYASTIEEAMNSWPAVGLTINPAEGGTTNINGEENVVHKYVPNYYELPLAAVPAEGYHFVSWTDGTSEIETVEYTKIISGGKGDVIELTANFAKNSYNINVTAGEGGSATASAATVEHGSEVTLTATRNDGYVFAGWYNSEGLVSAEANYTFPVTSDINYEARFNQTVVNPTTFAIHVTAASTDGTTVTNSAEGNVKAVVELDGRDWVTDYDCPVGANIKLIATSDYNNKAYLFDGWYKNGECVSNSLEYTIEKVTEVATYEARFFRGCVVIGNSNNNQYGYITSITLADGTSIGYNAANRAVVKPGTKIKLNTYINDEDNYEVGCWSKDGIEIEDSNSNSLVVEVNEDVTYTANFEPVFYWLTVTTSEGGTASALLGTADPATKVKVGKNMEATITATAKPGYRFVEWTTIGGAHISENPYTVPAIQNVEDMVDVEYIAVFEEKEYASAGKYYRIAYDFEAPATNSAPSRSVATRAATTYTYTVTPQNGGISNATKVSVWNSTQTDPVILNMTATCGGTSVATIQRNATTSFKLYGYNAANQTRIKYTISVPDGYEITACQFTCSQRAASVVAITYNGNTENYNDTNAHTVSIVPTGKTAEFELSTTSTANNWLVVKEFTVTIQEAGAGDGGEGGETPEPEPDPETPTYVRRYVQNLGCGVVDGTNDKSNAMIMTDNTDAASIFYYGDFYVDNTVTAKRLMSYKDGKFVKEDGGTRGLQSYVYNYPASAGGEVTITTTGETSTIQASSYMHANVYNGTYFVDHCGSAGHPEHNFILEEVKALPVTITDAKYATFFAPVDVRIPANVQAWYLLGEGIHTDTDKGYASMTEITDRVIPANTPVVIGSEKPGTYNFEIDYESEADKITGNMFRGTLAAEYIPVLEGKQAYILSIVDEKVGLYKAKLNNNQAFLSKSHRVYLLLDDDQQSSNGFRLVFGTTAIEEVEAENNAEGIYDLSGRKLEGINGPGVYIVNGKKVLVK